MNNTRALNTIIDFSDWIDISAQSKCKIKSDELRINLKKNGKHQKMIVSFGLDVLKILKVGKKDKILFLQSPENPRHFLIVKAEKGYVITFPTPNYGRLIFNLKNSPIKDFDSKNVEYSIHPNNIITFYL